MGCDEDFLQEAINACDSGPAKSEGNLVNCPPFAPYMQADDIARQCKFGTPRELASDDCLGPRNGLCGLVPIESGPGYAAMPKSGPATQPTDARSSYSLSSSTVEGSQAPTTNIASLLNPSSQANKHAPGSIAIPQDTMTVSADATTAQVTKATTATTDADTLTFGAYMGSPVTTIMSTNGATVYVNIYNNNNITVTAEPGAEVTSPYQLRRHAYGLRNYIGANM